MESNKINAKVNHYVEKTYYNGTKEIEKVEKRDPLLIKENPFLVSIRFFDRNRVIFNRAFGLVMSSEKEPYNYSNNYYYGQRKHINELVREFEVIKKYCPSADKYLEQTINEMFTNDKQEIIVDYRCGAFNPYKTYPQIGDITIEEYKKSLKNKKVLKK